MMIELNDVCLRPSSQFPSPFVVRPAKQPVGWPAGCKTRPFAVPSPSRPFTCPALLTADWLVDHPPFLFPLVCLFSFPYFLANFPFKRPQPFHVYRHGKVPFPFGPFRRFVNCLAICRTSKGGKMQSQVTTGMNPSAQSQLT